MKDLPGGTRGFSEWSGDSNARSLSIGGHILPLVIDHISQSRTCLLVPITVHVMRAQAR
jgi:hypothetical protein